MLRSSIMPEQREQKEEKPKDDWGYSEENGPATWFTKYPPAAGRRQSPIDIQTSTAKYDDGLSRNQLQFMYKVEEALNLVNSGHSIQGNIKSVSEIQGGPLDNKYRLAQFHLHWGSEKGKGSEHTIDNKAFDAELHLVHFNEKYGEVGNAVDKDDGLAVVGIMLEEGNCYEGLKPVTDNACNVGHAGATCTVNGFDPAGLLPGNKTDYWTYLGSLTTPPLYESVTWIVLKTPVGVSKDQLDKLRQMKDCHSLEMQDNFRPPCQLQGRRVRKSFP